jgi:ubiquinone/menaquinone biosynthesis C-methylase UbiE
MFLCPQCKSIINDTRCTGCGFTISLHNGLPVFFSDSAISKKYESIAEFYDDLYGRVEDTWNIIADRGPEFVDYIAKTVMENLPEHYLDIGCGEGQLLAAVKVKGKYGLDISAKALEAAVVKTPVNACIGFAEEMLFLDNYFDTISSIGVMTHFIDDRKATKEINRILKVGGRYILGIYQKPSLLWRYYNKVKKMISIMKKPTKLILLFYKKIMDIIGEINNSPSTIKQPVEKIYSRDELLQILEDSGFIVIKEITKWSTPAAPLPGYHFRIFILGKPV